MAVIYILLELDIYNPIPWVAITLVFFYNTRYGPLNQKLKLTLLVLTMTLLVIESVIRVTVPIGLLMLIPLVTYNMEFEVNYILHTPLFQILYFCLYVFIAVLVLGIVFSTNAESIGFVEILSMKKKGVVTVLESTGKAIGSQIPKHPKIPQNDGSEIIYNDPDVKDQKPKNMFYSTERTETSTFPRICTLFRIVKQCV